MGEDDARILHLPSREVETVEAELVDDRTRELLRTERGRATLRREGYWDDAKTVARVTRVAVTHDRTRAGAKAVARNVAYIPAGAWIVYGRWRDSHTNSRWERQMRAAEACANGELLRDLADRAEAARDRRHSRMMDWLKAPKALIVAFVQLIASLVVLLLILGAALAVLTEDPGMVVAPIKGVFYAIAWLVWFFTIAWTFLTIGLPVLGLYMLWWIGWKHSTPPEWLASAEHTASAISRITPERVILALSKLGIPELAKAIRDAQDGAGALLSQIVPVGCGYQVDILPVPGVGTAPLFAKRELFAENLGRRRHEVFMDYAPSVRPEVRAWIANPGALDEPIGPSPLVTDPKLKANYKTGRAPWGLDVQGNRVGISLYQCHVLITGASNQGKSRALIALALWLALDPSVTFWIADLKGIDRETKKSDWEPMREIADRFVAGPSDDHVVQATEMVEDAVLEMERRITQGGSWGTLIVICDEAQKAFQCPVKGPDGRPYGGRKDTSRYFMAVRKLHDQGRVVDVLLWQGTQNPTNDNLPKLVREGAHIRGSLAVGSESVARMAMGDEAFLGGAAPHQLRKGIDKGTVVVTGDGVKLAPGQSSVTVRTHYLDSRAAGEVAQRALARRENRSRPDVAQRRDIVADTADVLSQNSAKHLPATDVVTGLRELCEFTYEPYQRLNGLGLAAMLRAEGVRVTESNGVNVIHKQRIWDALNAREGDT